MAGIDKLGNGTGYIYITEPDGATIVTNLANNPLGREAALVDGLTSAPIGGERLAQAALTITAAAGTIDNITINAVSIFDVTVPIAGATTALQAAATVTAINAYVSVPDYTAYAVDNKVYINPMPGTGSTVNGFAGAVMVTGPTAATITDMGGGAPATGLWDAVLGRRYYLDATSAAVEGVVSGTEISRFIINRGQQASAIQQQKTIVAGVVTIDRDSNDMQVLIETEAMAATDDVRTIVETNGNFQNGDRITFRGVAVARVTTFKTYSAGSDDIYLRSGIDFSTGDATLAITLEYVIQGGILTGWREISRSANLPTVTNQSAAGIAIAKQGREALTLVNTGTVDNDIGKTTSAYWIAISGPTALIGNVIYQPDPTPTFAYLDGMEVIYEYNSLAVTGGVNTITLGTIVLTDAQATSGNVMVLGKYTLGTLTWSYRLIQTSEGVTLANTTQLATKEPGLGNPAADGYVLSSTAAGARSWISNPNNSVLYNTTANNGTTAIITEEILKTYSLGAGVMDLNGDELVVQAVYQTEADANAKTMTVYFGVTSVATITGNFNAQTIIVNGTINRITSSTQSASFIISSYDTATGAWGSENSFYTLPTENLALAVSVDFAATNGVANVDNIISRQASVAINKFRS